MQWFWPLITPSTLRSDYGLILMSANRDCHDLKYHCAFTLNNLFICVLCLLCVMNCRPLFLSGNDVGRGCYGAMKVRDAFANAFRELRDAVLPQYEHIQPRGSSILGRILCIPHQISADYRQQGVCTSQCDVESSSLCRRMCSCHQR
jgi:hypothetical protein